MIGVLVSSLPMMVCGILSVLIALSLYNRWNHARVNLLVFMIAATVLYSAHFLYFNHQRDIIPFSDALYCFCNPAVFPLYYLYLEELTEYRPNRWRQALCLLPSVVCFLTVSILYLLMDAEETDSFVQCYLYTDQFAMLTGLAQWQGAAHAMVKVVYAVQIPLVLFFGLRKIRSYNAVVESNYSDIEEKRIVGAKTLLILFAVTSFAGFLFNLIGRERFAEGPDLLIYPSLLFSVLLLLIGHVGLNQQFTVRDIDKEVFLDTGTETTTGGNEDSDLVERIKKVVVEEKLYLYPNLKVSDLSQRLHSNRNYIYNAINVEMGISFTNYINRLRIDYASGLIDNHPEMTINDIMVKAGFTSSSSFYRNFKKFKGITPSEKRGKG